ncbi:hypothetical protein BC829DRAFT_422506 [Chytridium lagenaria]|nr:hypothetical protein BC829DRAFT_422506 [Chytridium lagenaria]
MPPKKAKGKKTSKKKELSSRPGSGSPQPTREYTFNGKRGDEAIKEFEKAALAVREKLKRKQENGYVVLRVRQVDFEHHDFLITLPKTSTIYRLQSEIASQQHGGAVFAADVVIYKTAPSEEEVKGLDLAKVAESPLDNDEKAPSSPTLLCSDPYARLCDVFQDVENFAMTEPSAKSSLPDTSPIVELKPNAGVFSAIGGESTVIMPPTTITFVHDLPNVAPQTPQVPGLGGILKKPLKTDTPSPLVGGKYVSIFYDILPYIAPRGASQVLATRRTLSATGKEQSRGFQLARAYSASVATRAQISRRIDSLPYTATSATSALNYSIPPIPGGLDRACSILMLEREREKKERGLPVGKDTILKMPPGRGMEVGNKRGWSTNVSRVSLHGKLR